MSPDADRNSPSWSQPLAPLPDWLESLDAILEETRRPRSQLHVYQPQVNEPPLRGPARSVYPHYLPYRAEWMLAWRARHSLDAREAAQLLGYGQPSQILEIETGTHVPRNLTRQRAQVAAVASEAIADPSWWLREWRSCMGISGRVGAELLGYRNRREFYRAEKGFFRPSWEKILAAHFEQSQ